MFAVEVDAAHGLYLDTKLDVPRIEPFLTEVGQYELHYSVLAKDFPVLHFTIVVRLTGDLRTTEAALRSVGT